MTQQRGAHFAPHVRDASLAPHVRDASLAPHVRGVGTFAPWVEHFEHNEHVHAEVDAAIGFENQCVISADVRSPLIDSIRRFQLGESGDGEQLLGKAARAGDSEYLRAAELFVAEEQQHAALLLRPRLPRR